nr:transposase [Heliorestis acidaminivorans]
MKKDLIGWKLGRVVTVVDRGFSSEDNIRYLQRAGGHYIAGEKLSAGKKAVEEVLSYPGRYKTIRENLKTKEVIICNSEARIRYVLVYNPDEATRDKMTRKKHLEHIEAKLQRLKELDGDAHTKTHCRIYSHRVYKQLLEVEAAFRTIKTTLELRPVYHRKEERIKAHVLLCWLALILIQLAEVQTKETWRDLRLELQKLHLIEYKSEDGRVWQRLKITQKQKYIFDTLKLEEPPLIWEICLRKAQKS